jgi:hypothetical protein
MKGLRIECESFVEVFAPIASEAAHLYWTMELTSGPFLTAHQPENVVSALDRFAVGSERAVWRPGVFPRFAPLLVSDEWGYFLAVNGPEEQACRSVASVRGLEWPADLFVGPAVQIVELLLIELEPGEWEVYSPHTKWLNLLRSHPRAQDVDSDNGEWVD